MNDNDILARNAARFEKLDANRERFTDQRIKRLVANGFTEDFAKALDGLSIALVEEVRPMSVKAPADLTADNRLKLARLGVATALIYAAEHALDGNPFGLIPALERLPGYVDRLAALESEALNRNGLPGATLVGLARATSTRH
jgi:hypothetical protein